MLQKDINKKGQVFAHNNIDCSEYAPEFYRVLKDGSHCYVMTNHINLIHMLNTFTDLRTDEEKEKGVSLMVSTLSSPLCGIKETRLWVSIICPNLNTFFSSAKANV